MGPMSPSSKTIWYSTCHRRLPSRWILCFHLAQISPVRVKSYPGQKPFRSPKKNGTQPTEFTRVPMLVIVIRISSPAFRVNVSGGTMPVPVSRKQPLGKVLLR
jgi:hypothetical protein